MPVVNVHQAKTQLSCLLARVEAGEDIVITRNGQPIARLVRCRRQGKRQFGALKGRLVINNSFFDSLPEAELSAWEA